MDGSTTTSSPFAKGGMVAVLLDSTRLCLLVGSCNGKKAGSAFHVVQISGHAPQNDKCLFEAKIRKPYLG